jgi:hypothetical protein
MKAITFAVGIAAVIVGLAMPAQAQSSKTPSQGEASSLSGTSLVGIDNRSTEDNFANFFGVINSGSTAPSSSPNRTATPVQFNQTLTLPDTPIYLQPAQQSIGGNDGVQVQVDLSGLDRPAQK